MPRRNIPTPKPPAPDPIYHSSVLSKFVKRSMWEGKFSVCLKMVYGALDIIGKKTGQQPIEVFLKALENVKPAVEVKSRRVGGSTYQVPVEIRESRREALAMRWIINAARNRSGKSYSEKLSAELVDAFNSTGTAYKKKEDTHKMAEANKAFSHYRW